MKNSDYSKKILKILAENKAISVPDLAAAVLRPLRHSPEARANATSPYKGEDFTLKMPQKERYAVNRALRNLQESGLAESLSSDREDYARITPKGRQRAISYKLTANDLPVSNWDGKWRIVLLDLPESRKNERESLRYLLKKAGFVCLKNSAWISPFPFEHLFMNIKKDLGLTTELMIFTTENLDLGTEAVLTKTFVKQG